MPALEFSMLYDNHQNACETKTNQTKAAGKTRTCTAWLAERKDQKKKSKSNVTILNLSLRSLARPSVHPSAHRRRNVQSLQFGGHALNQTNDFRRFRTFHPKQKSRASRRHQKASSHALTQAPRIFSQGWGGKGKKRR